MTSDETVAKIVEWLEAERRELLAMDPATYMMLGAADNVDDLIEKIKRGDWRMDVADGSDE